MWKSKVHGIVTDPMGNTGWYGPGSSSGISTHRGHMKKVVARTQVNNLILRNRLVVDPHIGNVRDANPYVTVEGSRSTLIADIHCNQYRSIVTVYTCCGTGGTVDAKPRWIRGRPRDGGSGR